MKTIQFQLDTQHSVLRTMDPAKRGSGTALKHKGKVKEQVEAEDQEFEIGVLQHQDSHACSVCAGL